MTQHMDDEAFLKLTRSANLRVHNGSLEVGPPPDRKQESGDGRDCSKADWKMCCEYFEANPTSGVDEAAQELKGKFSATRANQEYYESLTISKARERVDKVPQCHKDSVAIVQPVTGASSGSEQTNPTAVASVERIPDVATVRQIISQELRIRFPPRKDMSGPVWNPQHR